jgi:predicted tellurium resistance membrane protein TerC
MDNGNYSTTQAKVQSETTPASPPPTPEERRRQRLTIIGLVVGAIIILALFVLAIIYLANPAAPTEKIRDIFIIFMALEFLVLGLALIILIIQLATLINLLQNEVKPILESTNETANTLRGTAVFLSDNMIDPVIKLNTYLAGLRRLMNIIDIGRKR